MDTLRLAVQKSGRLSEDSLKLIKDSGIDFNKSAKLTARAYNFPIEFLFLRDDDIPGYVEDGTADIGIVGENVLEESGHDVKLVDKLGFSKCRLSLATPKDQEYIDVKSLEGKKIATSYPKLTQDFLAKHGVTSEIHEISGSVEIAPNIGLADAICDLVSTGGTLLSNGLQEVEVIMQSQAVMVATNNLSKEKQVILDDLLFRINSVQKAKKNKYILMNVPNSSVETIKSLLPGMKSPSVVPLAEEGWSSMHSVVNENDFWTVIDQLKKAGAEGILVLPIEKMIL